MLANDAFPVWITQSKHLSADICSGMTGQDPESRPSMAQSDLVINNR